MNVDTIITEIVLIAAAVLVSIRDIVLCFTKHDKRAVDIPILIAVPAAIGCIVWCMVRWYIGTTCVGTSTQYASSCVVSVVDGSSTFMH